VSVRSWDGDASYLNVPVTAALDMTADMTIAALIYPRSTSSQGIILSGTDSGGTGRWEFGIRTSGLPYFFIRRGDGSTVLIQSAGSAVTLNQWQIVGWTGFGTRHFHLSQLGSGTWEHPDGDVAGGISPMVPISGGYMSIGYNVNGLMAILGIWSPLGLTDGQVEQLDDTSASIDWTTATPPPHGAWNFDQAAALEDVPELLGEFETITGALSGPSDSNGIQGTTIDTTHDPAWDFAVPPPPLPFEVRFSGGAANDDPDLSLGGVESSEPALALMPNFARIDAVPGTTHHACGYVHNGDPGGAATVTAYFSARDLSPGVTMAIGLEPGDPGDVAQTIPDAQTPPDLVVFSTPASADAALSLGDIGPGEGKAIWLRAVIAPNSPGAIHNSYTLTFSVTPI